MKQDLTWGWAFGCVAALAIQAALMVLVAPWFAGWVHRLAGRLVGEPRFPAGGDGRKSGISFAVLHYTGGKMG